MASSGRYLRTSPSACASGQAGVVAMTAERIKSFAAEFDPQPSHLDEGAADGTFFGGLVASGWHTAAVAMRLIVDGNLGLSGSRRGRRDRIDAMASAGAPWRRPARRGRRHRGPLLSLTRRPGRGEVPDRGLQPARRSRARGRARGRAAAPREWLTRYVGAPAAEVVRSPGGGAGGCAGGAAGCSGGAAGAAGGGLGPPICVVKSKM